MGKKQGYSRGGVTWMRIDPYTHEVSFRGPRSAAEPSRPADKPEKPAAPPKPMVKCPDCGALVMQKRLARHQQRSCPALHGIEKIPCPKCSKPIVTTRLSEHLQTCIGPLESKRSKQRRRATPVPPLVNIQHEETGVYEDGGNFTVLYRGEVIDIVGSAKIGWEVLREHRRKIEG